MAIFGVAMQAYDDYKQAEHAKEILKIKRDIRTNFKEYSATVRKSLDDQLEKLLNIGFDQPITGIEDALREIRSESKNKSEVVNILREQLDDIVNLRKEIQSIY